MPIITLYDVIPLLGIVFTALLTVFIKVNANPAISYGTKTRAIKLEDYNISYDIMSASFITFFIIILLDKSSLVFTSTIGGTPIATDIIFLLSFIAYFYFYAYFMKRFGWKDIYEELSKAGVFLSSFFSITSLYFIYYVLIHIIGEN